MRNIAFELELVTAGSDPASRPSAEFDVHEAVARGRAAQAHAFRDLLGRLIGRLRRAGGTDPVQQAARTGRPRDPATLGHAAQTVARRPAARALDMEAVRLA